MADKPAQKFLTLQDLDPDGVQDIKPAETSVARRVGDAGLALARGAVGLPEAAVGLADIATGGKVGKALENEGGSFGFRPKQAKEFLAGFDSPAAKDAQWQFQKAEGVVDSAVAAVQNPSVVANAAVESVPLMFGGGLVGAGIKKLAPVLGRFGAGALGEGAIGAGSAAEAIRQETDDGLLTGKQAGIAAGTGLGVAALGAGGRKVAQRLGVGDVDEMIANRSLNTGVAAADAPGVISSAGRGALAEGVFEELPQSVFEQGMQNVALDRPLGENVDKAAVLGGLTGASMGAIGGVLSRPATAPQAAGTPTIDPAAPPAPAAAPTPSGPAPVPAAQITALATTALADLNAKLADPLLPKDPAMVAERDFLAANISDPQALARQYGVELAPEPPKESAAMGIDPAAGPVSKAAATAVDGGASAMVKAQEVAALAAEQAEKDAKTAGKKGARKVTEPVRKPEIPDPFAAAPAAPPAVVASGPLSNAAVKSPPPVSPPATTGVVDGAQASQAQQATPQGQEPAQPGAGAVAGQQEDAATLQAIKDYNDDMAGMASAGMVSSRFGMTIERAKAALASVADKPAAAAAAPEWQTFAPESGSLNVPRAEMPQIKTIHRGAMVNFLKARGVTSEQAEVDPDSLKPTQAEYSPAKVEKAIGFTGEDRSILVSSDDHIVDGHHQWLVKLADQLPVKVIRLNAPIAELLPLVREFPSSTVDEATANVQNAQEAEATGPEPTEAARVEAPAPEGGDAAPATSVPDAGGAGDAQADGIATPAAEDGAPTKAQLDKLQIPAMTDAQVLAGPALYGADNKRTAKLQAEAVKRGFVKPRKVTEPVKPQRQFVDVAPNGIKVGDRVLVEPKEGRGEAYEATVMEIEANPKGTTYGGTAFQVARDDAAANGVGVAWVGVDRVSPAPAPKTPAPETAPLATAAPSPDSSVKPDRAAKDGIAAASEPTMDLRKLSRAEKQDGDIELGNDKFVTLEQAMAAARSSMTEKEWGMPFQFNRVLDIAPVDWNRMVEAMTGEAYRDMTLGAAPVPTAAPAPATAKPAPLTEQEKAAKAKMLGAAAKLATLLSKNTLTWSRDPMTRKPVRMSVLEDRAAKMTTEDKAQALLRASFLPPGVLRMWQGLQLEQYEALVNSKYEREMLKPGIVFEPDELKSLFKLSDGQVKLYQEFRASVDRSLTQMVIADMVRFGGADTIMVKEEALAASTADEAANILRDFLLGVTESEPDRAAVLTDTANKMLDKAAKITDLIDRGYAPLTRFGNYSLDVVDEAGERVYFGLFESRAEANRMARQMRTNYPKAEINQGTMSQESYKLFAGVSPETLELFGEMLGLESQGDAAKDQAFQQYLKLAKAQRSAMKRLIQRKGIAGFSEDPGRVLAGFVYSNARQTSSALHMGEITKAASEVQQGDGELKDAALKLVDYVKNPQEEAQQFRSILFAQYLGGSIASAMLNAMQPLQVTFPWLSQFGGAVKAAGQMKSAIADVVGRRKLDDKLAAALKKAEDDGIVSPQEIFQLQAQAAGRATLQSGDGTRVGDAAATANNAMSKVMLGWGKLFGAAEQFNRRTTFIAAYRTAVAQGMVNPASFAERAVNETQFIYSKANKPRWARGAVGSILFTFKQYSVSYVELMHRMATTGGPEGKKAALLGLAVLFLMSGADGLPFAEDVQDLIDGVLQRLGYNTTTRMAKEQLFIDLLWEGGAQFVLRGASGLPGSPVDVSGRLGLGNLLPGTGLLKVKDNYSRDLAEFAGPGGDLVRRAFEAGEKTVRGEILGAQGALMTISPVAAANLGKAYEMATTGMYLDRRGKKVIDTDGTDALFKAVGIQPAGVARVQDASFEVQGMAAFNRMSESRIADKWAKGVFLNDVDMVAEARDDLRSWNAQNPKMPIAIKPAQIASRVKQMRMSKVDRIAKTAPAEIRGLVREELRRAGE